MGQCVDEVVVIPGAFFDPVADGNLVDVGRLEQVLGDAVDEGDVGGSVVWGRTRIRTPKNTNGAIRPEGAAAKLRANDPR